MKQFRNIKRRSEFYVCCNRSTNAGFLTFLCAFAKLGNATISFVMSLSVRLLFRIEQPGCHWRDCHESWYLSIFRKSVAVIQVSLKWDKKGYFTRRPIYIFNHTWLSSFKMRNVSSESCTENQNTHFMFNNIFFFRKLCNLWVNMEKYFRMGQATWQYGACRLLAGYLRRQAHKQNM
jgi:hypothetical protein